ncbi:MAG: 3-oxoacyl-[acyl-carrier protein] reductase [Phenylobacterium sp.]|nr:3-oxoacyl-[acyl-carrier protein] reductase [Phenylobacterium sp.]
MTDRYDLSGKVAVVTGATKGMGRAIAERFAQSGARVVISSRTAEDVRRVTDELNARYGQDGPVAVGDTCVIEDKADLQKIVDLAVSTFGGLTTLVCNACGMPWLGASEEMRDEEIDFQFLTVFKSKMWLVNAALPALLEAEGAAVVFISSGSAFETTTERNVYACMRAAELHYMRNIAAEYGPRVRVNAISPGLIETFSAAPLFADEAVRRKIAASVPLNRTGLPEEIASAVAFLASESSAFTTGTVLPVDGGRLLKAKEKVLTQVYKADSPASRRPA